MSDMPLFLSIETSAEICSVAIAENQAIISSLSDSEPNSHSKKLSLLTQQALQMSKTSINEMDAIVVSAGPGSFTGLRIGVSFAKGICFGSGKPLISVETLQAMATSSEINLAENELLCLIADAGNNEAYYAVFDHQNHQLVSTSLGFFNEEIFKSFPEAEKYYFSGNKITKWTSFLQSRQEVIILPEMKPSASYLFKSAEEKFKLNLFEDLSNFEPLYIRDFKAKDYSAKIRKILYSS